MRRRSLLAAATAAWSPAAPGHATAWPDRPVRFVMPGAAGGNPDILARIWAQFLAGPLSQPVIVENRPGAAGLIGTEAVMNAPPDGYTFMFGFNQLVTLNPLLYRRLQFDPARLTPVALLSTTSYVMLVPRSLPASSLEEFVALARQRPGRLVLGSSGPGSVAYLSGELLMRAAGLALMQVPFRTPASAELLTGTVQLTIEPIGLATRMSQPANSLVRAIVHFGPVAEPTLPGVPMVQEHYPGLAHLGFHALWGPPGLPDAIATRMAGLMIDLAGSPALAERMQAPGTRLVGQGAAALRAATREDWERWEQIIRAKDIRLD
jgi:tripartite-type tricarboxylate transporter receptor subunit TctC